MEASGAPFADATPMGRSQRVPEPSADEEPLLSGIYRVAQERLSVIILVTICVCAATAALVYVLPVTYSASAEVIFDPRKSNGVAPSSDDAEVSADPSSVQNQIRILTSRNLAALVIERLGLASDPEFNTTDAFSAPDDSQPARTIDQDGAAVPAGVPIPSDRVIDAFLRHLNAQPLGLSTTIAITFTSRDPQTAYAVANAVADAYIENQIDIKSKATRVAAAWLSQRVQKLAIDTQKAEALVQDYKRANGISEVVNGLSGSTESTPLVDQELVALQTQLVQARATLAEKHAVRDSLQALVAAGSAADLSQVSVSPLIVQLRQQESDIIQSEADLSARYGPKNPKLIAIEAQRKGVENKIAVEIDRIARAVDSDVVVAQAQVQSLQSSLERTEQQAGTENMARAKLQSLEANAKSTRAAYEAFVSRLRDVQGQEAMQVADANIISRAPVPNTPNPPSRKLLILASIPCGFLLGLLAALLQERAEAGPRRIAPQPLRVNTPVLARIPDLTQEGLPGASIAETLLTLPFSGFAQSIAELERRIPADLGGNARVIGIVSPASRDGMAVIALSVARAAAQRGRKVVVIDVDPGQSVAKASGSRTSLPGLPYVLSGQTALGKSLVRDASSGALLLSGEWGNADPDRLLGSHEMRLLLDRLRSSCDLVLLSLPYGTLVTRAAGANLCDATIVLLGWGGVLLPTAEQAYALASGFRNAALVFAA